MSIFERTEKSIMFSFDDKLHDDYIHDSISVYMYIYTHKYNTVTTIYLCGF